MKENTVEQLNCFCNTHPYIHCFHMKNLDPISRRVTRPAEWTDLQFYDRLMSEADSLMHLGEGDIALCLYEQAYEVARDCRFLGFDGCLAAAIGPFNRGFFDRAYKLFAEMTQEALQDEDIEILEIMVAFLNDFGGFKKESASDLIDVIVAKHPEITVARFPESLK